MVSSSKVIAPATLQTITIAESVQDSLQNQGVNEARVKAKAINFLTAPDDWKPVRKWALCRKAAYEERGHVPRVKVRTCLAGRLPHRFRMLDLALTVLRKHILGQKETFVELGVEEWIQGGVQYLHVYHYVEKVEASVQLSARRK